MRTIKISGHNLSDGSPRITLTRMNGDHEEDYWVIRPPEDTWFNRVIRKKTWSDKVTRQKKIMIQECVRLDNLDKEKDAIIANF